ncbi:hypothetical protein MmiHf6_17980 [Methanimicrococcus hongohii]|uniref:Uncharacterized protein n=1 Tax=Methanimicrococcus hongohii TaxID=3028295 RepID=A0AA97A2W3_9EURY|nr:hypothetical protein MmiHf6_17980 [Methanimicrococcus sp. Hf6]
MADSSHAKIKTKKQSDFSAVSGSCKMLSYPCLLLSAPNRSANLQLSFSVAAVNQVCVSAYICSFYGNPFAFANVLPLPSGLRCRRYLRVCAAAATFGFALPLLPSGLRCCCRQPSPPRTRSNPPSRASRSAFQKKHENNLPIFNEYFQIEVSVSSLFSEIRRCLSKNQITNKADKIPTTAPAIISDG